VGKAVVLVEGAVVEAAVVEAAAGGATGHK